MSQNDFSTSFNEYLKKYIQSNQQTDELELRFGTNYSNKITRIDFDNVVKKLKLNNFTCKSPNGQYHLNIQNEFLDERSGRLRMSNIRTEIKGLMNIKKYFYYDVPQYNQVFMSKFKFIPNLSILDLIFNMGPKSINYLIDTEFSQTHSN